jgi:predicted Fe-Mo cluster-binding NifX family protein
MKIILTATAPDIDSNIDPRFGRGGYFIVVEPDTMDWQAHANPGIGASGGAGTLAAQFAADQHADSVLSGDFGPNAYNALRAANIAMYLVGNCATVREAVEQFKAGKLARVEAPTGPGHPARGR